MSSEVDGDATAAFAAAPASAALAAAPASAPAVALAACGLGKSFGARKALDQVSFELPYGAFLSVFGPNGAGKTTLLRILATLTRPTAGTARVLGLDIKEQADELRAHIGLISHRSMLYPDLSAEENLLLAARLYGVKDPAVRVAQLLAEVEMTARRHDLVRGFSRGMTQRLAIARAVVHDPALLFLDEPYSGLDPHAAELLDHMLAELRAARPQNSFVMVSHDLAKGFSLATHVMMLVRGKVLSFAARDEVDLAEFSAQYGEVIGRGVV